MAAISQLRAVLLKCSFTGQLSPFRVCGSVKSFCTHRYENEHCDFLAYSTPSNGRLNSPFNNASQTKMLAHNCVNVNCVCSRFCSSSASSVVPGGQAESSPKAKYTGPCHTNKFDPNLVSELLDRMDGDLPLDNMADPFEKDYHRCFLCTRYTDIELNYKNVRLLSQFVSPYTGRIYGRAVTGLCIPMQQHVAKLIKASRYAGFMPYIIKDPRYLFDPQPYNPMDAKKFS